MHIPLGELAALGTAACWTLSSIAFSAAGKRIGSLSLNIIRLVMAFSFVTLYCAVHRGMPLPLDATAHAWGWLLLSGFVGFVLGDICLFRAFVLLGPRLTMLIGASAPPIASFLGYFLLNERMSKLGMAGMVVTLMGIVWVIRERQTDVSSAEVPLSSKDHKIGVLLAFGGAVGQAAGMVLGKMGMGTYDPVSAGQIRIIAGIVGFSALFVIIGWWKKTAAAIHDRRAMGLAAIGSFAGPFVGVSLSLLAIKYTETGIAVTLMSLTPVFIIPVVLILRIERVSARAAVGAIVAVVGVAMLWVR